jgi:hypothetical protein
MILKKIIKFVKNITNKLSNVNGGSIGVVSSKKQNISNQPKEKKMSDVVIKTLLKSDLSESIRLYEDGWIVPSEIPIEFFLKK